MLNPALNRGLPPFLANNPGINSGYMIVQLTAASLVSEDRVLSHPACVDNIPTSANQEDFVSMGSISANKVIQVVENVRTVLAIELMVAAQALDQRNIPSSSVLEKVKSSFRQIVPTLQEDRIAYPDLNSAGNFLKKPTLLELVQAEGINLY